MAKHGRRKKRCDRHEGPYPAKLVHHAQEAVRHVIEELLESDIERSYCEGCRLQALVVGVLSEAIGTGVESLGDVEGLRRAVDVLIEEAATAQAAEDAKARAIASATGTKVH